MDHQKSLSWVRQVIEALEVRLTIDNSPRADIEWLILRCRDTLRFDGEVQRASLRQLDADVAAFVLEFPGQLPENLLPAEAS